jgi:hypothetical protein
MCGSLRTRVNWSLAFIAVVSMTASPVFARFRPTVPYRPPITYRTPPLDFAKQYRAPKLETPFKYHLKSPGVTSPWSADRLYPPTRSSTLGISPEFRSLNTQRRSAESILAEIRAKKPLVESSLPLTEAEYARVFGNEKVFNANAEMDVIIARRIQEAYGGSLVQETVIRQTMEATALRTRVEAAAEAGRPVIVVGHVSGAAETQVLHLRSGGTIPTAELATIASRHDVPCVFVTCYSRTFGTGKIDLATAERAVNRVMRGFDWKKSPPAREAWQNSIRTELERDRTVRVKVVSVGTILFVIVLENVLDDLLDDR